jgi:hypothetical protein
VIVGNESPKEKLLDACGVARANSTAGQKLSGQKEFEAVLNQAAAASALALQAQKEADKTYRRLDAYLRDELPVNLVKAFETVAKSEVAGSLRPLDECVHNAASRIESCAESMARISWNGRLIWLAVLTGLASASLGGCLVRYAFFDGDIDEAKRFEAWGRKVAQRMERSSPKERARVLQWVNGGRL